MPKGDDAAVNAGDDDYMPAPEEKQGGAQTQSKGHLGDYMLMCSQIVLLLIWTFCCKYGVGVSPKALEENPINSNIYPCFQDVNVMIFIGFGYLMTYLKAAGQSTLSFNWMISIWCIQWGILSQAFFAMVFSPGPIDYIQIDLASLIWGLFAAATAMISYGALLGKCTLPQLIFLMFWEMLFWGLNVAICTESIMGVDMGGSIIIHAFGCFFGLAASYFFQPNRANDSPNNSSNHNSEIIALVGSIFLWMFWPSFNGALAHQGNQQNRVFCNTNLSIAAGCIGAGFMSRIFYGKLEMTIIMNATLAGGVAIGTCSDIITSPAGAMWLGFVAGIMSAYGFDKMGPFFQSKFNLQDTCGVFYLHGQPGLLGGFASMVAIGVLVDEFPKDYFPANNVKGGSQVLAQLWMILVTMGMAIGTGVLGGFICKLGIFSQPDVLFKDDDHVQDVVERYPQEYVDMGKKDD